MSRPVVLGVCLALLLGAGIAACGGDDDALSDGIPAAGLDGSELSAYGLTTEVPSDWEGRISWENDPDALPTMQLASFPFPSDEGLAIVAPQSMPEGELWLALAEHPQDEAEQGLFGGKAPVRLRWDDFDEATANPQRPGHRGSQDCFSASGRAFCLYVVASEPRDQARLDQLNEALGSLEIEGERGERRDEARVARED